MAKPYKEGKGWSIRFQALGEKRYLSGFKTNTAAQREAQRVIQAIREAGAPAHKGPARTSVGEAFAQYARERLPYLKGARQDANRINAYLRACRLPIIQLSPVSKASASIETRKVYWDVSFTNEPERKIVPSLQAHRKSLLEQRSQTASARSRLAQMSVSDVSPLSIEAYLHAMAAEGYAQASRIQERAELNRLFNHARRVWRWVEPRTNPAAAVRLAAADNARDRVLTNQEWSTALTQLNKCQVPQDYMDASRSIRASSRATA